MARNSGKKVGMKAVAEMAGVSVSAVSMALADSPQIGGETKRRVRDICRDIGYPLKRANTRRRRSNGQKRFGFMSLCMNLTDEGLAGLLHALAVHAAEQKIRMELSATPGDAQASDMLALLKEQSAEVDGLLISGICQTCSLQELADSGLKIVMLGHFYEDDESLPMPPRISSVQCDSWSMGRLATQYLISRGHRRIGFFCERAPRGMYAWKWLMGYRAALHEAGLSPEPDLVHLAGRIFAGGGDAARNFLALEEPPTAYVCTDVRTAASFLEAMRENNVAVNRDNLVIGGHQDIATRYGMEGFPLIDEDAETIAEVAMDLLDRLVDGNVVEPLGIVVPFRTYNFEMV